MSQYATTADFALLGLPAAALSGVSATVQNEHLEAASGVADMYLAKRHKLPLVAYDQQLTGLVCSIAAWTIQSTVGFNPQTGADPALAKRHDDAISMLKDVSRGLAELNVTDSSSTVEEGAPIIVSDDIVPWGDEDAV